MAIVIPIISQFVSKGFDDANKATDNVGKTAVLAAAGFAAVTAAIGSAIGAAVEDAAAQDRLRQTLEKTTGASKDAVDKNEDFISSLSRSVGIADDQLRPALGNLVTGTKDLGKAQELLGVALDVSAATGKDLGEVSEALSKGFAGNTKGLKALSPELAVLIKDGADFSEVLKVLEGNFGGAADAAGNTTAGQFRKLKVGMGELQEGIGAALLPALEQLIPVLLTLSDWAQDHSTLFAGVIAAVGALSGLLVVLTVKSALAALALKHQGTMHLLAAVGATIQAAAVGVLDVALLILNLHMFLVIGAFVIVAVAVAAAIIYWDKLKGVLGAVGDAFKAVGGFTDGLFGGGKPFADLIEYGKAAKALGTGINNLTYDIRGLGEQQRVTELTGKDLEEATKKLDASLKANGDRVKDQVKQYGDFNKTLQTTIDKTFDLTNADMAHNAAAQALQESVEKNGTVVDTFTKKGIENLKALTADASATMNVLKELADKSAGNANAYTRDSATFVKDLKERTKALGLHGDDLDRILAAVTALDRKFEMDLRISASGLDDITRSILGVADPEALAAALGFSKFAAGGIVTGPTLALIGESGPEAVIPLSQAGNLGGTTYNISVDAGLISSGVDVGQMIIDAIQRAERRSGPVFAKA